MFRSLFFQRPKLFLTDRNRKNVLFIPGGPGQFGGGGLKFLESNHNVVYFDLRGSGFSGIPPANVFDKYLRAEFVVEDIEQLRTTILGAEKTWDAIYAVSYGSVIAQQYAQRYPNKVKKLILVPPVPRHKDTEQATRNQALSNVRKVSTSSFEPKMQRAAIAVIRKTINL